MTNSQENPPAWLSWLARNRLVTSYLLFALALVPAGLAIWWGLQAFKDTATVVRWDLITLTFWMIFLAVAFAVTALFQLLADPGQMSGLDAARLMVLVLGGIAGLATALAGVSLAYAWWAEVTSWLEVGKGKELWKGLVVVLTLFVGLAIMFASLNAARTQERSNALLRRLLYGYNTVLTMLLLLVILAVVDSLLYIKVPQAVDFTSSSIYTLNSRSINILHGLEKPTKIYVILSSRDPLYDEVKTLLVNCRDVNPRIEVEEKSPDLSDDWIDEMSKTYPSIGRSGLLVVYGDEGQQDHRFIRRDDLFTLDDRRRMRRDPNEKEGFKFKGEDTLMTELDALMGGKEKPILYVTQGNGELELNNTDENRRDVGLGLLRDRLKKRNFEVKPLTFDGANPKVPDDATTVLIAGPRREFPEAAMKALREYMSPTAPGKRKGKLMALLEPPTAQLVAGSASLEAFLKEYSVDVPNKRLLAVTIARGQLFPLDVLVMANAQPQGGNPIANAFRGTAFRFYDARPVEPIAQGGGPRGSSFQAETFLSAPGWESQLRQAIWAESNLKETPRSLVENALKQLQQNALGQLSTRPISVGVTVTEGAGMDPHAGVPGAPPLEQKPRLVVIGDATIASNYYVSENAGREYFDLLASSLDWLRERPTSIGIEPKSRNLFVMPEQPRPWPLTWIPTVLMLVGIVGLGTGVWVVRRR